MVCAEQNVWRTVCREIAPKHERYAVREYREAKGLVGGGQSNSVQHDRAIGPGFDRIAQ